MVEVALALGSNQGNRRDLLLHAVHALQEKVGSIVAISAFIETLPVGFISSHPFLNGALVMKTSLPPLELLQVTQEIEKSLGRKKKHRPGESYTDRPIDIDILLYGEEVINQEDPFLQIPHPRMQERNFVLTPLTSISPLAWHPILHCTIKDLQKKIQVSSNNQ